MAVSIVIEPNGEVVFNGKRFRDITAATNHLDWRDNCADSKAKEVSDVRSGRPVSRPCAADSGSGKR